eukprot:GHVN01025734.1.p1 GENE.GHVN01025734.1~~GHVN01025734.1.p1  ORF type:complete len:163 (+),score=47.63 GHVN01025734.1:346-834(+)
MYSRLPRIRFLTSNPLDAVMVDASLDETPTSVAAPPHSLHLTRFTRDSEASGWRHHIPQMTDGMVSDGPMLFDEGTTSVQVKGEFGVSDSTEPSVGDVDPATGVAAKSQLNRLGKTNVVSMVNDKRQMKMTSPHPFANSVSSVHLSTWGVTLEVNPRSAELP